jgi:hypothetical protein
VERGGALRRLIGRTAPPPEPERCELCSAVLPDEHRHVLDLVADELRCACRACALLFEREAAARGHYRLVPQRRVRLDAHAMQLAVPVGLAFFVVQPDGSVRARYPSPVGATSWEMDATTWQALVAAWPQLAEIAPAVEALLVDTARGADEHWIVPIDDCYRLVAVIREHWTGLSGGREVWPAVDRFFAELARPARGRVSIGSG